MTADAAIRDDTAAMMRVLEAAGERGVDIVPIVFECFFAAFPEARALFPNLEAAAGRMVNETLEAMLGLAENAWWVETTIVNFVDLHRNYGAIPDAQWTAWVDMTVDALAEAAGEGPGAEGERAWRRQAERLKAMIAAA
ncbi:globin [Parasphingopyxis algicola]|uniref:globin n=1 Tax=Parasphingopyxis algicola TaxID=2026624 RepID=UPI0015A0A607|nr:globin [Parasphingopyxis algicola]QLC25729.1 globin [Parasphingopyxis algicola]